jgi:ribosome biogenesis GTPase A
METSIQWFPGHMTKAIRKIREQLKIIDLIVFVLDARLPNLSFSPMLNDISKTKNVLCLLNKSDLAEKKITDDWQQYYREAGLMCFRYDAVRSDNSNVRKYIYRCRDELLKTKKHRIFRPLRIMVLGIPNVGKSSFINNMVKQKSAKTANKPGVTKGNQWLRILEGVELLDTPGVLMPKIERRTDGLLLALCGAIRDGIVDEQTLLTEIVQPLLIHQDSHLLAEFNKRYLADLDNISSGDKFLEHYAQKNGFIRDGKLINATNAAQRCIAEFRKGLWGKFSFERIDSSGINDIFSPLYWEK